MCVCVCARACVLLLLLLLLCVSGLGGTRNTLLTSNLFWPSSCPSSPTSELTTSLTAVCRGSNPPPADVPPAPASSPDTASARTWMHNASGAIARARLVRQALCDIQRPGPPRTSNGQSPQKDESRGDGDHADKGRHEHLILGHSRVISGDGDRADEGRHEEHQSAQDGGDQVQRSEQPTRQGRPPLAVSAPEKGARALFKAVRANLSTEGAEYSDPRSGPTLYSLVSSVKTSGSHESGSTETKRALLLCSRYSMTRNIAHVVPLAPAPNAEPSGWSPLRVNSVSLQRS